MHSRCHDALGGNVDGNAHRMQSLGIGVGIGMVAGARTARDLDENQLGLNMAARAVK